MSYTPKNFTASATLTRSDADATITVNAAAGLTLTLPAATGLGDTYTVVIGTTVTSNSVIIKVANSSDIMAGSAIQAADAGSTSNMWEAGASDDTITLNGTTTGGIKGDRVILQDVATNLWSVTVIGAATGTEATPFSATV
jgi:hypothetical protein